LDSLPESSFPISCEIGYKARNDTGKNGIWRKAKLNQPKLSAGSVVKLFGQSVKKAGHLDRLCVCQIFSSLI